MTSLAKLIKYGEIRSNEASNYHNTKSANTYAYLYSPIKVDGQEYIVNMDIKKTPNGNRFYIHSIKIADKVLKPNESSAKLNTLSATTNSILQDSKKSQENFFDQSTFTDTTTGETIKYSVREEAAPKKTIDVYKLMRYDYATKKLYPLYIDRGAEVVLGTWYNADSPSFEMLKDLNVGYHLIDVNTGEVLESRDKMPSRKEVDDATTKGIRWMSIKEASIGAHPL